MIVKFDQNLNNKNKTVSTTGQKLLVQFSTDGDYTNRGFNASFHFNPIDNNCANWLTSNKLVSPKYPHANCSWLITASVGNIIYIKFNGFQVEHSFILINFTYLIHTRVPNLHNFWEKAGESLHRKHNGMPYIFIFIA